jgi:PAS domain S-box-containing protein
MSRPLGRGLGAVVALLVALIVADVAIAYRNIHALYDGRVRVERSREVQLALQRLLSMAKDAETGVRGFVITGDASYLEPYTKAQPLVATTLEEIAAKTADNPRQRATLASVGTRLQEHFAELARLVQARRLRGFDGARAMVMTDRGKAIMDRLRDDVALMEREESYVLEARAGESVRSMEEARASATFAALLGVLMTGILVIQMRRSLAARDADAARLGAQRELFRTTLSGLGEGVVTCDAEGRVTFMNETAEDLTGWSAARAVGQPVDDVVRVVDAATHEPLQNSARRTLEGGRDRPMEYRGVLLRRGGGDERPVDDGATRIFDAAGQVAGVVVFFRDISERKRSEDALREADRRKDEFLATLAHELRNPLAPLRNAVEIARLSGAREGPLAAVWATMERQVLQMVRLIDDLLDVSRVTRNKLELRREPLEVREVVDAAVEMSLPVIERYGHRLDVTVEPGCPRVDGDRARLVQAVDNLLTNAAKYSEAGGHITLTVSSADGAVEIRVRDRGIGIPPHMLDRIFEMFTQVDRRLERTRGGLGIGLTLVKRIVEMHGGSIVAKSEGEGCGSEFVIRLPVAARDMPVPVHGELPSGSVPARRIVVTDDNVDSASTLAQMLRIMGHEVHVAHDGLECLRLCERVSPEIVFLDIGMPNMNGYDAARRLREGEHGRSMLLVAVTGWGQESDRRRAAEAGFDQHVVKPIGFSMLAQILHRGVAPHAAASHSQPHAARAPQSHEEHHEQS